MNKLVVIIFTLVIIFPSFSAIASNNQKTSLGIETLLDKKGGDGETEYWAVIIGISDYYNISDLAAPSINAKRLFNLLIRDESGKWGENNINLLLDEKATKNNILNALDWLRDNADDNDTILFYFDGHGGVVDDEDGDEKDEKDEILCPYDTEVIYNFSNLEESECFNYITDDELSIKFENISKKNIKGMFLIFSCCLSGGLVNWESQNTNKPLIIEEKLELLKEYGEANLYSTELSSDINVENKVVLTSTIPEGLGIEIMRLIGTLSFGKAVVRAIQIGKTTAEDIASYAKRWWLSKPRVIKFIVIYGILPILFSYFNFLENVIKTPLIFPFPMIEDQYPSDHPSSSKLSII
jgi:hypothetical protein